jgi:hypothetical protein
VLSAILRWAAVLCSLVLILSFGAFAYDEISESSEAQQDQIEGKDRPAPSSKDERQRERDHSDARELIDDANDILVSPFADLVDTDSAWAARGIPFVLALLVFGVGLGFLSRFGAGRA